MTPGTGFLTRLARSKRAATLPLMAAAVIPLVGMLGGGLDLSRLYIVKTRLQHACDAGALAGRRTMGGGTWTQSSNLPQRTAVEFFDSNIENRAFGATVSRPTFTESAGRVTGNATATVPMTLMRVFGYQQMTLTATCDAEMRLPNTDVMFVLDVTGSMAQTIPGDTSTKIAGLRRSVKCFYEILARLNTTETCEGGDPSGGVSEDTQIRFGFVPFATNVNVGRLLPSNFFRNVSRYQSREVSALYGTFDRWDGLNTSNAGTYSGYTDVRTYTGVNSSGDCTALRPADEYSVRPNATGSNGASESAAEFTAYVQSSQRNYRATYTSSTKRCVIQVRTRNIDRRAWLDRAFQSTPNAIAVPAWHYGLVPIDFSTLKNGTGWNSSFVARIGDNFANRTLTWDGCIEERDTVREASYWPIPENAFDLEIDVLPDPSDERTRWAPTLPGALYQRREAPWLGADRSTDEITTFTNFPRHNTYSCPVQGRKLDEWNDASIFSAYVDSLQPTVNTYHDIGMIWGARLLSPTGIFASENAATPQGGEIERHMIFMTDGEACTDPDNYQAYGFTWYDRRQVDESVEPESGQSCSTQSDPSELTRQVDERTSAICEAVKNRNITLWVIWFDQSKPAVEARMRACATAGRFYIARNSTQLQQAFRDIASQISQLRLTS